jgi:hypothetical protein
MADKKNANDVAMAGGNKKSAGKGGGKSTSEGAHPQDPAGNVKLRGGDPSPDNRRRGETSATR